VRLVVNWPLCDGNGVCTVEVPELLDLDEDDNLVVKREHFDEALRAKVDAAVRVCPKHALAIEQD
jgi:ferredoxin